jgi:hypothetical protein
MLVLIQLQTPNQKVGERDLGEKMQAKGGQFGCGRERLDLTDVVDLDKLALAVETSTAFLFWVRNGLFCTVSPGRCHIHGNSSTDSNRPFTFYRKHIRYSMMIPVKKVKKQP